MSAGHSATPSSRSRSCCPPGRAGSGAGPCRRLCIFLAAEHEVVGPVLDGLGQMLRGDVLAAGHETERAVLYVVSDDVTDVLGYSDIKSE